MDYPLTESEYRAWLAKRPPEIAAELSTQFADRLPDGVHFEWHVLDEDPPMENFKPTGIKPGVPSIVRNGDEP